MVEIKEIDEGWFIIKNFRKGLEPSFDALTAEKVSRKSYLNDSNTKC